MTRNLWRGQTLQNNFFENILPSFRESYFRVLKELPDQAFLTFYDQNGKSEIHTRRSFHTQVEGYQKHFDTQDELLVTLSGNEPSTLAAMTAALLSGRKLCPMNPQWPAERVDQVVGKIALKAKKFANGKMTPLEHGKPAQREGDFIYILTSGTTGHSKIVRQSEANILSNVEALIRCHGLASGKTILTPLPVFHVNALEFSFFCTLLSHSKLVLLKNSDPQILHQACVEQKPGIISLAPSILRSFLDYCEQRDVRNLENLSYMVSAAAPLPKFLYDRALHQLGIRVLQGFGLSEAVNFSTMMPPDLAVDEVSSWMRHFARPSIGTPLAGNDVEILDDMGRPMPPGEQGELAIQGYNVMPGYLDEDKSSCFTGDYMRTGDLGFYELCPQGRKFFFINGRKKEIIKKNGMTISLVETDEILLKLLQGSESAIAVGFPSDLSGENMAILFGQAVSDLRIEEIRNSLLGVLPEYQWPAIYAKSETEVRSPSGKALRSLFISKLSAFAATHFPKRGLLLTSF